MVYHTHPGVFYQPLSSLQPHQQSIPGRDQSITATAAGRLTRARAIKSEHWSGISAHICRARSDTRVPPISKAGADRTENRWAGFNLHTHTPTRRLIQCALFDTQLGECQGWADKCLPCSTRKTKVFPRRIEKLQWNCKRRGVLGVCVCVCAQW